MPAVRGLGQLNKNISEAAKDLKKLSSGMKINGAGDDASGYAISERMRVQIRSLDQDVQNVKNGRSLLNLAAGAIDNIVDELRNLKELALNAANDTNTDDDRAIIQKEFDNRTANINDIASTTNYNGIPLLDGRWNRASGDKTNQVMPNKVTDIFANSGFWPAVANPTIGKTTPAVSWINGRDVYEGNAYTPYPLDFSSALNEAGNPVSMPSDMDGQGFFVVCAGTNDGTTGSLMTSSRHPGCPCSHAFVFDAGMAVGTATSQYYNDYSCLMVRVGIAGVTDIADLPTALYQGVNSLVGVDNRITGNGSQITLNNSDTVSLINNGNGTYSISRSYGMWLYEGYLNMDEFKEPNPLVIHTGPKANQNIHVHINDMHTYSLRDPYSSGHSPSLDDAKVTTRDYATEAIDIIDGAIDYALNEATYVGAYISRLDFTEENLTTANENTTAAESVIRDADMAREAMNYARDNILSQASQSMLAQANQNASSVLNLLQ